MDADGYPDQAELDKIANWSWEDLLGWFEYIEKLWAYRDCGYWQMDDNRVEDTFGKPIIRFYLHTAGWSGNENIISAMEKNWMCWHFTWLQSQRGGHYIFDVSK